MGYGVPDTGVDFVYITPHEAYALLKNDKAAFVDSRDLEDYESSRLQTSFHVSANSLILATHSIDLSVVEHLKDLSVNGKTIVVLSDACITGAQNRGHVSRCRHVAQYLVALGVDRRRIVRMSGGINAWKTAKLDGILGDLRPMFAGAFQDGDFSAPLDSVGQLEDSPITALSTNNSLRCGSLPSDQADAKELLELGVGCTVEITGLKSRADLNGTKAKVIKRLEEAGRWEVEVLDANRRIERVRCKPSNLDVLCARTMSAEDSATIQTHLPIVSVCCGGDVCSAGQEMKTMCQVILVPPRPFKEDTPTAYRVLKGDVYQKASRDSDKVSKLARPVSAIVRTTGQVFQGINCGLWAELDMRAGENKGWVYIRGPGFGPSTRHIAIEFLRP